MVHLAVGEGAVEVKERQAPWRRAGQRCRRPHQRHGADSVQYSTDVSLAVRLANTPTNAIHVQHHSPLIPTTTQPRKEAGRREQSTLATLALAHSGRPYLGATLAADVSPEDDCDFHDA
jgi:hypothetical protein